MAETRWLTAKQAAEKLDVSSAWVRYLCQQGRMKGAEMLGVAGWMIPDPPVLLGKRGDVDCVSAPEAARIMGISRQRVFDLCMEGKIKGAAKKGRFWEIPYPINRISHRPGPRPTKASKV